MSRRDPLTKARLRLEARRSLTPLLMWCALVGIALYAGFFLFSQLGIPLPWQHQYNFRVAIADAKGVVAGSDQVRIAGVVVGKITAVNLEGSEPVQAVLSVEIGKQYAPIYKNARAELRPNTPLDDMYLDIISRGTRSAGAIGQGGELAADRTQTSVEIGQILDVFNASVRPRVEAAIDQSGIGLGDHGAQFRQALVELAPFLRSARRLSTEIATRQSETRMLVHNLNLMSAELAKRSDQLNGLVVDAGSTFSAVGNAAGPLAQTISELPSTLEELVPAFTEVRSAAAQLDPALQALLPTARALPSGLRAAMQLAGEALPAAERLNPALRPLAALIREATPLANSLATSFARLTPQIPELKHVLAVIVPCETPAAAFLQEWNSVFKYYDDNGAFGREENDSGVGNAIGEQDPSLTHSPSCAGPVPSG
jgi:virulence factor Mce-like protein